MRDKVRKHFYFSGDVQMVGFRYQAKYAADDLGLTGWVCNLCDGRVEMEVQGRDSDIDRLLARLADHGDGWAVDNAALRKFYPGKYHPFDFAKVYPGDAVDRIYYTVNPTDTTVNSVLQKAYYLVNSIPKGTPHGFADRVPGPLKFGGDCVPDAAEKATDAGKSVLDRLPGGVKLVLKPTGNTGQLVPDIPKNLGCPLSNT